MCSGLKDGVNLNPKYINTGTIIIPQKTDLFISQSVWTFFIIVILLCLPAFFEKPDTGKSKEDPVTPIHQDVTVD